MAGRMLDRDVAALIAFINRRRQMPHAWGRTKNDCVAFALGAAEAQTGRKRGTKLTWSTRSEALRVIRQFGTLEAAFDHYFQRIAPAMAHRGDIAGVADDTFGIHPMIVEGDLLVGPGDKGNRHLPRRAMIMAWSAVLPQPRKKKAKGLPGNG